MKINEEIKKQFTKEAVEKGTILFNNNGIISINKDDDENYDAFDIIVRDNGNDYCVYVGYTPDGEILLCQCTEERMNNQDQFNKLLTNCEHEYAALLEIDKYYQ